MRGKKEIKNNLTGKQFQNEIAKQYCKDDYEWLKCNTDTRKQYRYLHFFFFLSYKNKFLKRK